MALDFTSQTPKPSSTSPPVHVESMVKSGVVAGASIVTSAASQTGPIITPGMAKSVGTGVKNDVKSGLSSVGSIKSSVEADIATAQPSTTAQPSGTAAASEGSGGARMGVSWKTAILLAGMVVCAFL